MSPPDRREFIMPVEPADAAKQFEIEAMRLIASNLEKLGDKFDDQAKILTDVHTRVTRIESNRLDREVAELKAGLKDAMEKIDLLESDRDRRDGALGFVGWLSKNAPWLLSVVLAGLAWAGWVKRL